jgi:hypothetical protein
MRVVIFGLEKVRIVRRDDRQSKLVREGEDPCVELRLPFRLVRLDLEVVAAASRAAATLSAIRFCATSPARQADDTISPSLYRASSSRSTRGLE